MKWSRVGSTALLMVVSMAAGPAAAPRDLDHLRDWIRAVRDHTPGEADDAAALVASWSHAELERLRPYVEVLTGPSPADRDAGKRRSLVTASERLSVRAEFAALGDPDLFRRRAVVLHTDVALVSPGAEHVAAPVPRRRRSWRQREEAEQRVLLRADDGQAGAYERASLHWELAMGLLDVIHAGNPGDEFVPLWYRAIGAHFAGEYRFGDAVPHFARAHQTVQRAPGILFGDACLQETLAAPRIQEFVRVTVLANGLSVRDVTSPRTHLRRAEALLREVLTLQPSFTDARLRLARILTVQERPTEAEDLLNELRAAELVPRQQFFHHLFHGDAQQALGRFAAARASFERAVALFPHAQSARLALALSLRSAGTSPAALQALLPVLTPARADREGQDPWEDYHTCDAIHLEAFLEELRAPLRQPR